jgi:hypothetical protein
MSIYHITRTVKEEYRIEANSRDEAVRKLNRAKPDSTITGNLIIREIPSNDDDRPGRPERYPQGPGPW